MSYATPAQVKSLFRHFADNSEAAVIDTEIQDFLDDAEEIINAKLGTLYTMPITDPAALKILKRLETFQVAAVVDDILNNYSEADKKPQWKSNADKLMKDLVPPRNAKGIQPEPTMKLPNENYLGTSTQRGKITLSRTSGTIFKKGANNW